MTLRKDHLINKISSSNGFPKKTAGQLLESLLELIKYTLENAQRTHSPLLAAGLVSELKIGKESLHLGDTLSRRGGTAGFFNPVSH